MATLDQLQTALVNADKAGDVDAARRLAAFIKRAKSDPVYTIPGTQIPGTWTVPADPSLMEKAIGTGEAALTTVTGATGGAMGIIGGTLKGLAEQILSGQFGTPQAARAVEDAAMQGAQALTYEPRTQSGRDQAAVVGEMVQNILPIAPLTGQLAMLRAGTAAAAPAAAVTAGKGVQAVKAGAQAAKEVVTGGKPTSGTLASGGAAGVDAATLRRAKAAEVGFEGDAALTEGQAKRSFEAQRFEREAAKNPELGEPIRERFANQNRNITHKVDAWIDEIGAEAPDLRSIGVQVDSAIRSRAARDKARIRSLYQQAEKAGELEQPSDLSGLAQYLNENRAGRTSAPIMQTIAEELKVQGIGDGSIADGSLQVGQATLKQAESVRKAINRFAKADDANDLRVGNDLKTIIDASTEGRGGNLYSQARAARARYAKDYENIGLVRNIIGKKRGSADRSIALEDVLNRSVISPSASLDDVRQIRRLLQTEGDNGKQAWRELQGGTLKWIKDESTKNVARNERGDPIVSAAQMDRTITQLDRSGKLDYIFGKKGAEQLRTLNDVAKDVLTSPPGAVNTSNTASVVLAAMDMAISGTAGVPAPILSTLRLAARGVKNARLKARINKALGE